MSTVGGELRIVIEAVSGPMISDPNAAVAVTSHTSFFVVIAAFERINDERGGRSAGGVWNGHRYSRAAGLAAAVPVETALSRAFPCEEDSEIGRSFVSLKVFDGYFSHFESFVRGSDYDEHDATFALAYAVGVYDLTTELETVCAPKTVQMLRIPVLGIEGGAPEDNGGNMENAADKIGRGLQEAFPCADE